MEEKQWEQLEKLSENLEKVSDGFTKIIPLLVEIRNFAEYFKQGEKKRYDCLKKGAKYSGSSYKMKNYRR